MISPPPATKSPVEGGGSEGDESRVKVYSFQRDTTKAVTEEVFVRYNFSRDPTATTDALTVCYWVRFVVFVENNVHFSYTAFADNLDCISVGHREDLFFLWSINTVAEGALPGGVMPEVWYHACHLFDSQRYSFYWQGEEVFSGQAQCRWPFLLNGTVVLGQEQDHVGGGFDGTQVTRGDITQVYMWGRLLEPATVRRLASCGTAPAHDILFSTETSQMEVFGAQEDWLPRSSLCREQPFFAILPEERSLQASLQVCQVMDGSLALPTSPEENSRLTRQMMPFSDVCVPTAMWKLWLGTQMTTPGRWEGLRDAEPITYQNFRPSSSTNSSVFSCAELRLDGYWEPDYCKSKRCTACSFVRTSFLLFRGLCFDKELETRFRVVGSPEQRPVFWSHQGLLIAWSDSLRRWQMEDPNINATLMWGLGVGSDYPLGRRLWRLAREMCGQPAGHTLHASLSSCATEEFTCSTGECIAPHLRCNFHYDCPDHSDEASCAVVEASNDALLKQVPPPPPMGSPQDDILQLQPSMTLTRVAEVNDLSMSITLEFKLTLTWSDPRVNFRHLGVAGDKGTMLTEEDGGRLWRPLLRVANLDGNNLKELGRRFQAKAIAPPTQPTFNDVDTDGIYEGRYVHLHLTQRFLARVACYLELYSYPFDQQQCAVEVQLAPESGGGAAVRISPMAEVKYTGPETLAMYTVKHVQRANATENSLRVEFELHRRQGVIMLSTFLPSGLLLLVSWATLFVKISELNVRAIMSLTTLLVLYTLFANMSRSLPATASIKLIDVWFFFIIFLLFTNIVVHICVRPTTPPITEVKVFVPTHPEPAPRVPEAPRLLRWYRLVILPVLVVLFNLMFWLVVLTQ
ncbi:uncharacterized protein LOC135089120 isoform X1 [Scylla paramamosain]|uniref:uncharacterized protein LOC135089120 isoform X1 n=2 Tax=Scylla paramamosain TaxID=85552 RepID=UPI003083C7FB